MKKASPLTILLMLLFFGLFVFAYIEDGRRADYAKSKAVINVNNDLLALYKTSPEQYHKETVGQLLEKRKQLEKDYLQ